MHCAVRQPGLTSEGGAGRQLSATSGGVFELTSICQEAGACKGRACLAAVTLMRVQQCTTDHAHVPCMMHVWHHRNKQHVVRHVVYLVIPVKAEGFRPQTRCCFGGPGLMYHPPRQFKGTVQTSSSDFGTTTMLVALLCYHSLQMHDKPAACCFGVHVSE